MTKRTNQTKTTVYRRHAGGCPIKEQPLNTANCECPLWIHGKIRGKFIREALDTRTLATAVRRQSDLENGRDDGDDAGPGNGPRLVGTTNTPKGDITVEYAASEFLKTTKDLAGNTQKLYTRCLRWFRKWAEQQNLEFLRDIGSDHIRRYFEDNPGWGRGTQVVRLVQLGTFFNFCKRTPRRWIAYAPTEDRSLRPRGKKAKAQGNDVRVPFTPTEVTAILAAVEQMPEDVRDRARGLIYLLLYSGMRISDATFAERACLLPNNFMEYYVIKTGKAIDLPPELQKPAIDALAKLPKTRVYFFHEDVDDDYGDARRSLRTGDGEFSLLMPNYESRVNAMSGLVRRVLKLAGVTGTCHSFRDTFAVSLLTQGVDVYSVSKALGHSDVRVTDKHYLKLVPGYRERMSQCTRALNYQFPQAG